MRSLVKYNKSGRKATSPRQPSIRFAGATLFSVIVVLLVLTVVLDADLQLAMLVAFVALVPVVMYLGHSYADVERFAFDAVRKIMQLVMIILSVGAVIGSWAASGTIPLIIHFGLSLISPKLFLLTALVLCAMASLLTGTSYGTIGSVGVAMMAIGVTLGVADYLTAAAVICGAYFGDKLSPLSDSTNLASAITGTPLLTHVRNLLWTTLPAIVVSMIAFTIIGFGSQVHSNNLSTVPATMHTLEDAFRLGWVPLLPLVLTIVMLIFRAPAFIAIFLGAITGAVVSVAYQGASLSKAASSLYNGYQGHTGMDRIDDLVNGGGVVSMYPTVGLFILAVAVSGLLSGTGIIAAIVQPLINWATTSRRLTLVSYPIVLSTLMLGASYPFSAVVSGTLLTPVYREKGLAPRTLARTLEDTGIIYDPVFPWTAGGIYCTATLGVATSAYAPFLFFTYTATTVSIILVATGLTVKRMSDVPQSEQDVAGQV